MTGDSTTPGRELLDWMTAQRWYGDKSRTIAAHEHQPVTTVELGGETVAISAERVEFTEGGQSTYLATRAIGDSRHEATSSAAFLAWLAAGFAERRTLPAKDMEGAHLVWTSLDAAAVDWTVLPGRLIAGEQSNSSIIYGDAAIVKLFRKLQPGINPDSEIVAFLTERTTYRHVPTYLGGLTLRFDDNREAIELAAVQGFVANDGDCWRWLPGALAAASDNGEDLLLDQVGLLGRRTGELHAALATGSDLPAFSPEIYTADEARDVAARIRNEVAVTCEALRSQEALADDVSAHLNATLGMRIGDGSVLTGLPRIRVHGDYHLGQVLRANDDFVIIDFEGEPSRSMAERRQKHAPLKDVAGMLRSLDYAVSSASHDAGSSDQSRLIAWGRLAETRFVDGYRSAVASAPIQLVPDDPDRFSLALDLYVIEKAVYEVRYELDNRPDWLHIPLDGLRRIADSA
ncbi:MAG TPA: phosphotransferase [Thermomicrobiales bacterium]|nr:phosphotransferase [Thermomicrobiales bacterium]